MSRWRSNNSLPTFGRAAAGSSREVKLQHRTFIMKIQRDNHRRPPSPAATADEQKDSCPNSCVALPDNAASTAGGPRA